MLSCRKTVSLVMTPAHVLRLASMPEPEKVEPTGVALAGRGRPRWGYQRSEWKLVFRSEINT